MNSALTTEKVQEMKTQWTAAEIAALTQGEVLGNGQEIITGAASIGEAREGDIVFAETEKYLAQALRSRAAVALVPRAGIAAPANAVKTRIAVENPRLAFTQVLEAFAPPRNAPPGIHPAAIVAETAKIGAGASIAANVTIGANVTLGERVLVLPGACLGENCVVGDDTVLHPNVVLYPGVTLGKRCILHAGCVIGSDGFGYIQVGQGLRKVPQLGTVIIHDDVEMGANCCVDRAKTGATVIGVGVKMDNMVHVGHGVKIGPYAILIAQVALGGGAEIGAGAILAGQSGVVDHVTVGAGAKLGAQSGAISRVPDGASYSGFPARPHSEMLRGYAAVAQLPEYLKRIRDLEKRLAEVEGRV